MSWIAFLVGVLAVWRVTHLLHVEDGPWGVFSGLRAAAGVGFWGGLLGCFYCLSLWTAVPVAGWLARGPGEGVVVWLALSGGAILLERATGVDDGGMPAWVEHDELRQGGPLHDLDSDADESSGGSRGPGASMASAFPAREERHGLLRR